MDKFTAHLIFTDGSSLGNPGPGGWGAVLVFRDKRVIEIGGGSHHTTNNRMEMMALIEGLRRFGKEPGNLIIYLDSSYVEKGATEWIQGWIKRGWKTMGKRDVENRDLWEMLHPLVEARKKFGSITWVHVPGHSGVKGNERADGIASGFAAREEVEMFEGTLGDYAFDILNIAVDDGVAERRSAARIRAKLKPYSYLSLVGGVAKRHTTWAECEKRVMGKSNVKYKKAISPHDEKMILKSWRVSL